MDKKENIVIIGSGPSAASYRFLALAQDKGRFRPEGDPVPYYVKYNWKWRVKNS